MKWIDTINLTNWAQRRDSQEHLPLLVRKLIRATSNSISSVRFPSGENVLLGGWDGIVEVYQENQYLPLGVSLWELGTNRDVKGKADDDYDKRTENPISFNPKEATYVFVTPRRWSNKTDWVKAKKAEAKWKDIRVYDAEDLEEWIDTAPTVGAWFALKHLGIMPAEGIQPADDFWDEWSTGNKINFVPDVVLAGRLHQSKLLLEKSLEPEIIAVQGNSREEALAFTIASFLSDPTRSEDFFSRSIIVDSIEAFRELLLIAKPLNLICRFDDDSVLNRAKSKGHTVFVPFGFERTDAWSNKIILPPLQRDEFVQAMVKSGMTEPEAEEISKKSARNLIVVRRQLEFKRLNPLWSLPENVKDILPAVLAGRWNEDFEGDRKILEVFAGENYEAYIRRLQLWCFSADAPIVKIGSSWRLTSPMDAWTHAARYLTKDDFKKLAETILDVLLTIHKKFSLSSEDRHRASWFGIQSDHSSWLREGMVQTLTLTSIFGEKLNLNTLEQPVTWVNNIVYKLLDTSNLDSWRSLDHEMSAIAEASPMAFLTCLEKYLQTNPSPIIELFAEEPGMIEKQSYYTGLLWAIEGLAWMPELLSRCTLILRELAVKDPGSRLANRPINTLNSIFRSWYPQTFASFNSRIEALGLLQTKYIEIGKSVLLRMLPEGRGVATHTHKMRWRLSDRHRRQNMDYEEIYNTYRAVLDLLIAGFDDSENYFVDLLEKSVDLDALDRDKLLDFLEAKISQVSFVGNQARDILRKILGRHRSYPTADWSLSEQILKRYEGIYNQLLPNDDVEKIWWLFEDNWPVFPEGRSKGMSHVEQSEELQRKRNIALMTIYNKYGFNKILELIEKVSDQEAGILGFTIADIIKNEVEIYQ